MICRFRHYLSPASPSTPRCFAWFRFLIFVAICRMKFMPIASFLTILLICAGAICADVFRAMMRCMPLDHDEYRYQQIHWTEQVFYASPPHAAMSPLRCGFCRLSLLTLPFSMLSRYFREHADAISLLCRRHWCFAMRALNARSAIFHWYFRCWRCRHDFRLRSCAHAAYAAALMIAIDILFSYIDAWAYAYWFLLPLSLRLRADDISILFQLPRCFRCW